MSLTQPSPLRSGVQSLRTLFQVATEDSVGHFELLPSYPLSGQTGINTDDLSTSANHFYRSVHGSSGSGWLNVSTLSNCYSEGEESDLDEFQVEPAWEALALFNRTLTEIEATPGMHPTRTRKRERSGSYSESRLTPPRKRSRSSSVSAESTTLLVVSRCEELTESKPRVHIALDTGKRTMPNLTHDVMDSLALQGWQDCVLGE